MIKNLKILLLLTAVAVFSSCYNDNNSMYNTLTVLKLNTASLKCYTKLQKHLPKELDVLAYSFKYAMKKEIEKDREKAERIIMSLIQKYIDSCTLIEFKKSLKEGKND